METIPTAPNARVTKKFIKSAHGHHVQVSHEVTMRANGIHEVRIQAQVGTIVQTHTLTLGPQDSGEFRGPAPTVEQLQAKVDKHKTKLADEASWRHSVTENLKSLI